jgi:hypothetical protein
MPTRNLVPRVAGEGSIGTASRPFGAGHFDTLYVGNQEVISGGSTPSGDPVAPAGGGSEPTITVTDASAMQTIINTGSVEVGQLFSLVSDRSIRRFEGNGKSRIISDLPQGNPTGYARMTSVKTSNISITLKHDGTDGALGICYSVNGGAPVYSAVAAGATKLLSIPHANGSPIEIAIWPASSATSGRKGNLTYVACYNNQLTSLDLAGLTALSSLSCNYNQLTSLDVSGLTALSSLSCYGNQLTSLDVSGLTALSSLACYDNQLTSLDVSGLTALTYLRCDDNQLTSLNVSGLTALTYLRCDDNQLTSLNVSGLTALTYLRCNGNQLTSLDVSGLTALTYLSCRDNPNLSEVIAAGTDGVFYYSSSHYTLDFKDCALGTDAVYSMLDQMATADPQPSWIDLSGNPCDGGTSLTDGETYTGAETEALAAAKGYTLFI